MCEYVCMYIWMVGYSKPKAYLCTYYVPGCPLSRNRIQGKKFYSLAAVELLLVTASGKEGN